MKNFNVIYVGLISFLTVFCMNGMDLQDTATKILSLANQFITQTPEKKDKYLLDGLYPIQQKNAQYFASLLGNEITYEDSNWLNRVINYNNQSSESNDTINKDLKKLRSLIIGHNFNLVCNELENTFTATEIKDEEYAKELIETLKSKSDHRKSLFDKLKDTMFPKLSYEKPNLVGAKTILAIACNNQYFNKYYDSIERIKRLEEPKTEKRRSLTNLYNELNKLRELVGTNPKTVSDIITTQADIKKALKELGSKPQPDLSQQKQAPMIQGELGQSQLSNVSSLDFESSFNDLNASCILSDDDMKDLDKSQALEVFQKASQNLSNTIYSLLKDQSDQIKDNIIKSLDEMGAYIYKYDLTPKEENAPYKSYRCWLLELIKNVIETNNTFTQAMIDDWKIQLETIAQETKKRSAHPIPTSMETSELAITKAINATKTSKISSAETFPSATFVEESSPQNTAEKAKLKEEIDKLDQELKASVFDITKLSTYLKALKSYKKLLSSQDKKEQQKINRLIKTTANKIKRLTIIKPREKTQDEIFLRELDGVSAKIGFAKNTNDLKKIIIKLEEHLPIGKYYDASQVISQSSSTYNKLLTILNQCVSKLAKQETSEIKKDSDFPLNYFKEFTSQIMLFTNLNNQSSKKNDWFEAIIKHYAWIIEHGANILIKQISKNTFFSKTSLDTKKTMIN